MSEQITDVNGVNPGEEGYVETFAAADTKGDKPEIKDVPYTRFKEVNDGLKTANAEIEKMKLDQKNIAEKKLTEDGKFKELNETLTKERDELKADNEIFKAGEEVRRKALIEILPEEDRELYGELGTEALQAHINKIESKTNLHVSNPGGVGKLKSMQSVAEAFNRGELTVDQYKTEKAKFNKG